MCSLRKQRRRCVGRGVRVMGEGDGRGDVAEVRLLAYHS